MEPRLAVVELRVKDWVSAATWFQTHLQLQVKLEDASRQYVLLRAGQLDLAIKGHPIVDVGTQIILQWEVEDVEAWQQRMGSIRIIKPLKVSPEGYRRIVVEGPENLELVLFDWKGDH